MNLPNRLTVARMVSAPFFLASALMEFPHKYLVSAIIFVAAAFTDMADGRLARKNDQVTVFGQLLDPVADKMLTTAALLAFLKLGLCSVWIVMIILAREFVITSVRLVASAQGVVMAANVWGKLKTACQMIFTALILVLGELEEAFSVFERLGPLTFPGLSNILLWITAALALVSGTTYLLAGRKSVDFSK
ncbi:MAG: CDP-diacylglycerol--glycerol-3-phosphate 3-phosphatidyltransferase [Oscillospiraceae bacterium]|nr:CDP-diacylglycerol--glycerol-3-phosphate 3-phosphatidyltransferase [Oscillospiraceae bacterium]